MKPVKDVLCVKPYVNLVNYAWLVFDIYNQITILKTAAVYRNILQVIFVIRCYSYGLWLCEKIQINKYVYCIINMY